MKKAFITGITGQDGAYLAELLLSKGYEVHGLKRRSSLFNTDRIDHLYRDPHAENVKFFLHHGDLSDGLNLTGLIQKIQPDEIYNLGAMSHVKASFEMPEYTANIDGLGTLRILEVIRVLGLAKKIKFYQASTSELYGLVEGRNLQSETTKFYPRSPYAVAKLYSYWITVNYREAYNIFASNGILFNHESPIRGETFVTRKITRAACRIALGLQKVMHVGNLDSKRDWGHARDYVEAMWLMLQHHQADDFVVATGVTTQVRDFIMKAFRCLGIDIAFEGRQLKEQGVVTKVHATDSPLKSGDVIVRIDPKYFRPTEVEFLVGDSSKARRELNWNPVSNLDDLLQEMIKSDLELFKRDLYLKQGGQKIFNYYE